MPGKGRIDSIIDIPSVKSEYDELKKMLGDLGFSIKNAGNADALKNPSISMKDLRKAIAEVLAEQEKLIDNTKKTQKAKSELERAEEKLINSYSAEARSLAEIKEQQTLVNRANKLSAQETLGLIDAYKRLEIEYNKAQREAKNLLAAQGAGSKEAQIAAHRAFELGEQLKKIDAAVNQHHRNVGNYTNALKILEKELGDVKKKIEDYTKSGNQNADVLEELRNEQELLQQLVNNQTVGFSALAAELKENEKALLALKAAGKEDTEMYRELFVHIAQAKDELKDFKEEMANRGSGELALTAAIEAAQTLTAVYGIAEGATALFGEENEQLQKTMVKLQAVLAILTSLEALNNTLKRNPPFGLLFLLDCKRYNYFIPICRLMQNQKYNS
ncbi:hypothetical protein [Paraflavitalea speifideaquila]|uniref:hypothetical protein n=1 Tax=Paraflavitalea speifideaquila TaxID=3076558 RepID=UPI0028E33258|nr:hypothetical protein [Paraflavitalea speifideiaquila]